MSASSNSGLGSNIESRLNEIENLVTNYSTSLGLEGANTINKKMTEIATCLLNQEFDVNSESLTKSFERLTTSYNKLRIGPRNRIRNEFTNLRQILFEKAMNNENFEQILQSAVEKKDEELLERCSDYAEKHYNVVLEYCKSSNKITVSIKEPTLKTIEFFESHHALVKDVLIRFSVVGRKINEIDFQIVKKYGSNIDRLMIKDCKGDLNRLLNFTTNLIVFELFNIKHADVESEKIQVPSSVIEFYVSDFDGSQAIFDLSQLAQPKDLAFEDCLQFNEIPDIPHIEGLEDFSLRGCTAIDESKREALLNHVLNCNVDLFIECYHQLILEDPAPLRFLDLMPPALAFNKIEKIIQEKILPVKDEPTTSASVKDLLIRLHEYNPSGFSELKPFFAKLEAVVPPLYFDDPKLLTAHINPEATFSKYTIEESPPLEELPDVQISALLDLLIHINFTDPMRVDYVNPDSLTADGVPVTVHDVRANLENLINRIEENAPYLAVPEDPEERKIWYKNLEIKLQHVVKELQTGEKRSEESQLSVNHELLKLGISGQYCGTRSKNQADCLLSVATGDVLTTELQAGVEGALDNWIDRYKEATANDLARSLTVFGVSNTPHTFAFVIKALLETGVNFSQRLLKTVDFQDSLLPSYEQNADYPFSRINQMFLSRTSVAGLVTVIHSFLESEFAQTTPLSNDVVDCLTVYAENHLLTSKEKAEISEMGQKEKYGHLVDLLVDKGLLYINDDYTERKITSQGVTALLEHWGYLTFPSSAAPTPTSSSS